MNLEQHLHIISVFRTALGFNCGMSRRASFFARTHPGVRRVRFPDEIVFDESIKEADGEMIISMLRRASVDININRINMAGMTALHQVGTTFNIDYIL